MCNEMELNELTLVIDSLKLRSKCTRKRDPQYMMRFFHRLSSMSLYSWEKSNEYTSWLEPTADCIVNSRNQFFTRVTGHSNPTSPLKYTDATFSRVMSEKSKRNNNRSMINFICFFNNSFIFKIARRHVFFDDLIIKRIKNIIINSLQLFKYYILICIQLIWSYTLLHII